MSAELEAAYVALKDSEERYTTDWGTDVIAWGAVEKALHQDHDWQSIEGSQPAMDRCPRCEWVRKRVP